MQCPVSVTMRAYELPECPLPSLTEIVQANQDLFRTTPGATTAAYHYMPTTGTPVRVPPRHIPAHYWKEVERQLQDMLREDIIEESCSPWMAPAVFVRKKTGELRMCVDYREVNRRTAKDAYSLPLVDEVQDRLSGSTIFSTLDMRSGYWQMPVHPRDQEKTVFCPGPGMGPYQFKRMPFGLAGAPSSFQQLTDKIFRDLPFVTCYLDDVLVHSGNVRLHGKHLKARGPSPTTKSGSYPKGPEMPYWPVRGTILGPYFLSQGNVSPRRQESASSARLASAS